MLFKCNLIKLRSLGMALLLRQKKKKCFVSSLELTALCTGYCFFFFFKKNVNNIINL